MDVGRDHSSLTDHANLFLTRPICRLTVRRTNPIRKTFTEPEAGDQFAEELVFAGHRSNFEHTYQTVHLVQEPIDMVDCSHSKLTPDQRLSAIAFNDGDDTMYGGDGGPGIDYLIGGGDVDHLHAGVDGAVMLGDSYEAVTEIDLKDPVDRFLKGLGQSALEFPIDLGFQAVGSGVDYLYGGAGSNFMLGGGGSELLYGCDGSLDVIFGDAVDFLTQPGSAVIDAGGAVVGGLTFVVTRKRTPPAISTFDELRG